MERKKKRAAAIIITVFIGVFILWVQYAQLQEQEGAVLNENPASKKIEYKSGGLRDPFQEENVEIELIKPQEEEAQAMPLPALEIEGIVWGGRFAQAIINHKVLKIGDTIEGARVINIVKEGITVLFNNRQYNLSSPASQGVIKKKP